jgi:hypothetical protein
MPIFTIIGYWPDTQQRFADHIIAKTAARAEARCLKQNPGLAVCGVIKGRHMCADRKTKITEAFQ